MIHERKPPMKPPSEPHRVRELSKEVCRKVNEKCNECPLEKYTCGYEGNAKEIENICEDFLGVSKSLPVPKPPQPSDKFYAEHYQGAIQPLEIMQAVMSHEAFCGFLEGNCIKYGYRAGRKDGESAEKDKTKFERYANWLAAAQKGEYIDPRKE